ncbi:MAG: type IX secretion system membrane protein PorP/SprF [Bacteroidetes bacterium]|nr:type IX secretion system membrane protein PorP/SprF [Bacteroidota bacterium]
MKKILTIAIILTCIVQQGFGQQDPVYSQYMFNGLILNPAYAGSREALFVAALYRDQWTGLDGAPTTKTISVHSALKNPKIGLGISLYKDNISIFNKYGLFASYAYRLDMEHGKLSLGLQAGFSSISSDWAEINAVNEGDSRFATNSPTLTLPNAGLGFYYSTDDWYVGGSVPRLINNKLDFDNNTVSTTKGSNEYRHYMLTGGYLYDINHEIKIKPSTLISFVQGAPMQIDINANIIFRDILWFGASYRSSGAVVMIFEYQLNRQFGIGYSYDLLLTKLGKQAGGSHEFMLRYEFFFEKDKTYSPRYF